MLHNLVDFSHRVSTKCHLIRWLMTPIDPLLKTYCLLHYLLYLLYTLSLNRIKYLTFLTKLCSLLWTSRSNIHQLLQTYSLLLTLSANLHLLLVILLFKLLCISKIILIHIPKCWLLESDRFGKNLIKILRMICIRCFFHERNQIDTLCIWF